MKAKHLSRRQFVEDVALLAFAAGLSGCTKAVTRYRSDGTPYTEDVDDPLATLAAVFLGLIFLGALAASNSDDDSSRNLEDDETNPLSEEERFQLASLNEEGTLATVAPGKTVSVIGSTGELLATGNSARVFKHYDTSIVAALLKSEGISDLSQPVRIRLSHHGIDSYKLEGIFASSGEYDPRCKTIVTKRGERTYMIHVLVREDGTTVLEIKSSSLASQHVA